MDLRIRIRIKISWINTASNVKILVPYRSYLQLNWVQENKNDEEFKSVGTAPNGVQQDF
jgi:hypothetical protein